MSSELPDPFFDSEQPEAARPLGIEAASVIADAQQQRAVIVAHRDHCRLCPGVAADILKGLLDNPIKCHLHV